MHQFLIHFSFIFALIQSGSAHSAGPRLWIIGKSPYGFDGWLVCVLFFGWDKDTNQTTIKPTRRQTSHDKHDAQTRELEVQAARKSQGLMCTRENRHINFEDSDSTDELDHYDETTIVSALYTLNSKDVQRKKKQQSKLQRLVLVKKKSRKARILANICDRQAFKRENAF